MYQIDLQEAKIKLSELLDQVVSGEDVIITRNGRESFRIVSIDTVIPVPKYGSAKGKVKMLADFDDPLAGFEEYMP